MDAKLQRKQVHRRTVVIPARREKRLRDAAKVTVPVLATEPGYAAFLFRVADVEIDGLDCECGLESLNDDEGN